MKSDFKVQDSESKAKGKQQVKQQHEKQAPPDWVLDLMMSVKRLEQKVDSTMNEVEVLKNNKDIAKEHEIQDVVKPERGDDEEDEEFQP